MRPQRQAYLCGTWDCDAHWLALEEHACPKCGGPAVPASGFLAARIELSLALYDFKQAWKDAIFRNTRD